MDSKQAFRQFRDRVNSGEQFVFRYKTSYLSMDSFIGKNFRRIKYGPSKTMTVTNVKFEITRTILTNSNEGHRIAEIKAYFKGTNQWYDQDEIEFVENGKKRDIEES